jgi:hypothetical protein
MKLISLCTLSTLAVTTLAWQCAVPDSVVATSIVNKFASFLSGGAEANSTGQALLSDDYQEISDSVNSLAGNPVSAC